MRIFLQLAVSLTVTLSTGTAFAELKGAIFTTDKAGTAVNQNIYAMSDERARAVECKRSVRHHSRSTCIMTSKTRARLSTRAGNWNLQPQLHGDRRFVCLRRCLSGAMTSIWPVEGELSSWSGEKCYSRDQKEGG
jgi:hypothetical protein